jgi:hypothetical protein
VGFAVSVEVEVEPEVELGVGRAAGSPVEVDGIPVGTGVPVAPRVVVGTGVPVGGECGCEVGLGAGPPPVDPRAADPRPVEPGAVGPRTGAHTRSSVSRALCAAARLRWRASVLSGGDAAPPRLLPAFVPVPLPVCAPLTAPEAAPVVRAGADPALPAVVAVALAPLLDGVAPFLTEVAEVVAGVDGAAEVDAEVDAEPSETSDDSSWASAACAESRVARSAVGSMAARLCPADTWSPTATCSAVTVPAAGKEAVTWSTRWAVPVRVSTWATGPRVTAVNR